ncbi:PqqD family protein [Agromyces sp. SYSU T00194]|uniref:PqqD family protein n=1 Tax=Agromyces chitinivorans TaxID=3158560 RepID=UPI003392A64E
MGMLTKSPGVGVDDDETTTYVAAIPWGPIVVLEGVAAIIWALAQGSARAEVPRLVAEVTGADLDEIREQVDTFLSELLQRGLLIEASV